MASSLNGRLNGLEKQIGNAKEQADQALAKRIRAMLTRHEAGMLPAADVPAAERVIELLEIARQRRDQTQS